MGSASSTVDALPLDILFELLRAVAAVWEPMPPDNIKDAEWALGEWNRRQVDPEYVDEFGGTVVIPLPSEYPGFGGTLGWVTVTHLNRSLRSLFVDNVPDLWASIIGRLPHGDETLLTRTGNQPLDVFIHHACTREWAEKVQRNIRDNVIPRDRIRSLTVLNTVVNETPWVKPDIIASMTSLERLTVFSAMGTQGNTSEDLEFPLLLVERPIPRVRCVNYIARFTGVTHLSIEQTLVGRLDEDQWGVTEDELVDVLHGLAETLQDLTLSIAFPGATLDAVDVDRIPLPHLRVLQLIDFSPLGFCVEGIVYLMRRLLLPGDVRVALRAAWRRLRPLSVNDIHAFALAGMLPFRVCSVALAPPTDGRRTVLENRGQVRCTFYRAGHRLALTVILDMTRRTTLVEAADRLLDTLVDCDLQEVSLATNVALPRGFGRPRGGVEPCDQSLEDWTILTYSRPTGE